MKINEFLIEGGWASTKTQDTVITPTVVRDAVRIMHVFEEQFNRFLTSKNLPPIVIGTACGSATYYERDMIKQPDKEYGDVDINFHIPEIPGLNNNQTATLFANAVKEFCEITPGFETENGKNVILQLDGDKYVQVDLVLSYIKNKEWGKALAPEWNVKGVLCASLYSALAQALNLSISGHGVQAKTINGERVKFTTVKGTTLHNVTNNKDNWAVDIAAYLGCKRISALLKQYPGLINNEVKVSDIVNSIKGIARSLELNSLGNYDEIISLIKSIYTDKINKAITSSKYNKAETPAAIKKAEYTKKMLADKSEEILGLF